MFQEINYSEILRLKHPPTLVIVRNKQEKIQENRYGKQNLQKQKIIFCFAFSFKADGKPNFLFP